MLPPITEEKWTDVYVSVTAGQLEEFTVSHGRLSQRSVLYNHCLHTKRKHSSDLMCQTAYECTIANESTG